MVTNCKYLGLCFGRTLLTLLICSRAVSLPMKDNGIECETLTSLYSPDFKLNDILITCSSKDIGETLSVYCSELSLVRNEISSCNLGSLLKEVPSITRNKILSKSQKVAMTGDQNICADFKNLNGSLYEVYLDKPGFAKQLSGYLCNSFCGNEGRIYCELLLRTYWIKKVFQEFKKETDEQANNNPNTSIKTSVPMPLTEQATKKSQVNPASSGTLIKPTVPVPRAEQASPKVEPDKHDLKTNGHSTATVATELNKNTHIVPTKPKPKPEPESPGEAVAEKGADDNTKKSKLDVEPPKADGNKLPDTHKTTLPDSNLQINANKDNQKETSVKIKQKISEKKPEDSNKFKDDQGHSEDPSSKPNDPLTSTSETKAKPSNPVNGDSEIKETPPHPIIQPNESDKNEGNDNLDIQISVTAEKAIDDDAPPPLERDKLENRIHEFGDGYAANEYPDSGPPDESEIPLPGENIQTTSKDGNVNVQPKETNVEKQVHDVSQSSAFPEEEDSHFFAYFLTIVVFCIAGYLVFHNKQKIIALIIEGRHERRRRTNNGTYKRLDSKDGAKATSHVIF